MNDNIKRDEPKKDRFALFVGLAMLAVILMRVFLFTTIRVDGESMQNTLNTGDNIIVDKISYTLSRPKRQDIIVCKFKNRTDNYVKRIIGLPGETISIEQGSVYIDGELLEDDSHAKGITPHDGFETVVPVDHYFVLGDNRQHSLDSVELSAVHKDDILGRGVAVVWPLNKIHLLTD